MPKKYDFGGYATRNDILCSDGRTIRKDAFKECDGMTVPIVFQHVHDNMEDVVGHGLLENRDDGVYIYGSFNATPNGKLAKDLVYHGDLTSLSIYANKLVHKGKDVIHGAIREVSLVLAGANPGAQIDTLAVQHGDGLEEIDDEAIIYFGDDPALELFHAEKQEKTEDEKEMPDVAKKGKTVKDVIDTMTEEQKNVMYALIGQAIEDAKGKKTNESEDEDMKHNAFDDYEAGGQTTGSALSHSDIQLIFDDARRIGSLRDSVLAHAEDYGIDQIELLFPDYKNVTNTPEWIKRETGWVQGVLNGVHNVPFTRIKSMYADITAEAARAKGYIKGNLKKEEVFTLLKRTTDPQTIYKKQKLDRDDVIDITDFDVVAWIRAEMRMMLNEEIARAILIGDGRLSDDDDKIQPTHIRPIWTDSELYTVNKVIVHPNNVTDEQRAKSFINGVIKARKDYKGSGNPVLYTTEDLVTDMLLIEDTIGHKIYKTEAELATALRVSKIVTVEPMENQQRQVTVDGGTQNRQLMGIIVNLNDYNVGADKGGQVSMFDDFDIDYNQQKYLIETRISGALVKPYSAIAVEEVFQ